MKGPPERSGGLFHAPPTPAPPGRRPAREAGDSRPSVGDAIHSAAPGGFEGRTPRSQAMVTAVQIRPPDREKGPPERSAGLFHARRPGAAGQEPGREAGDSRPSAGRRDSFAAPGGFEGRTPEGRDYITASIPVDNHGAGHMINYDDGYAPRRLVEGLPTGRARSPDGLFLGSDATRATHQTAVAFFDGQNLHKASKEAFGYSSLTTTCWLSRRASARPRVGSDEG